LSLHESQIVDWCRKPGKQADISQIESDPAVDIARLKRQLAEQEEALAIVKMVNFITPAYSKMVRVLILKRARGRRLLQALIQTK
jgi:hypothetical protein